MKKQPFVVYWNNIPSPYMVERFNALADAGSMEFEAWFNDRIEPDRSWDVREEEWRFRYRYLPSLRIGTRKLHLPTPVFGRRPDLLVSLYAEPAFLLGWAIAKLRGSKTAFWCQVTYDEWVVRRRWKEMLKGIVFPRVDATLGSGEESRQFAMGYGVPDQKALRLRHSIDVEHFSQGHQECLPEREEIRKRLGVVGTTFIYVGRLWWGKGLEYLLAAFHRVQKSSAEEVSLILVGDGPEEERLRNISSERHIRNVIFTGFHQKQELPRFYTAADVFVFPTLGDPYGLVVDEAMASCLPVVSTSAAGEIRERIEEGVNGYIVPPKDSDMFAERMLALVQDPGLRAQMGRKSGAMIAGHTPEQWAVDFGRVVEQMFGANNG